MLKALDRYKLIVMISALLLVCLLSFDEYSRMKTNSNREATAAQATNTSGPQSAATISYTYDSAGRLTMVDYGGGTSIRYTYDSAGNVIGRVITAPQWQAVVLTAQQIAQIKAWTVGGRTYVYVKPQFPDAGYRVVNWGQVVRSGNDFTVDASVEKFTGTSIQAVVTTAQIYDLGPLADGTYNFNFKTSGTLASTLQFTVSSATPPPNPIDTAREFVKQQYRDFLNREADQAGEDFWTDNITKCSDPARRPAGLTQAQCTLRHGENTQGPIFLLPRIQCQCHL